MTTTTTTTTTTTATIATIKAIVKQNATGHEVVGVVENRTRPITKNGRVVLLEYTRSISDSVGVYCLNSGHISGFDTARTAGTRSHWEDTASIGNTEYSGVGYVPRMYCHYGQLCFVWPLVL